MNPIRHIRRSVAILAALACAWLGLAAAAPAAFARIIPQPAGMGSVPASAGLSPVPPPATVTVTRTVVLGGMPGWQIALIAIGAALFAAAVAVLAYRALATRRQAVTAAA
jgi:uncharacterized protein (DUF111 family)